MFKVLLKKGLVMLSAGSLLLGMGGMTAKAGDFEVRYVHHAAGHGANQPTVNVFTEATGKDYIVVNCTYFKQKIANQGFLTEQGANSTYRLTPKPIYKKGKNKIYYADTRIPRAGATVEVKMVLGGYSDSNPMTVRGNL